MCMCTYINHHRYGGCVLDFGTWSFQNYLIVLVCPHHNRPLHKRLQIWTKMFNNTNGGICRHTKKFKKLQWIALKVSPLIIYQRYERWNPKGSTEESLQPHPWSADFPRHSVVHESNLPLLFGANLPLWLCTTCSFLLQFVFVNRGQFNTCW